MKKILYRNKTDKGLSAATVQSSVAGVAVFYVLLLMLNASALRESIERQPFGPARTFWLKIVSPPAHVSVFLRLDRPRAFVNQTLGAKINQ